LQLTAQYVAAVKSKKATFAVVITYEVIIPKQST